MRFCIICLLGVFCHAHCQTADTNLTVVLQSSGRIEATNDYWYGTKLLATGEWSKPLEDGQGHKLRTRITVYEAKGARREAAGSVINYPAAPVYLEIEDLQGTNRPPTQIYFQAWTGLGVELRDANGKPADEFRTRGGSTGMVDPGFWATVPSGGLLRLHVNEGRATSLGAVGSLNLGFRIGPGWVIPASVMSAYYLSATMAAAPADSKPADHNGWQGPLQFPAVKVSVPRH